MLSSISFHNFKGFLDQHLPLGPLTLLSGLNGTGKSSVLQAISMLRQSHEAGILKQSGWLLNGELVQLGAGRDVAHDSDFEDTADDIISIALTGTGDRPDRQITELSVVNRDADSDVLWEVPPQRSAPGKWEELTPFKRGFQYLRADRIVPAVTFPRSQHAVADRGFLGIHGEFAPHFLLEYGNDELVARKALRHPGETSTRLLSQVNAWMQELSPSVRLSVERVQMTDLVRLEYAYRTRGAGYGSVFRSTNVGFGLTHALPVLVACLSTPPGSMILIENPEAQLHPQGQVAVGKLLARVAAVGVQVIIETHSDHVLNGIRVAIKQGDLPNRDAHVHFFSRTSAGKTKVQSPQISENGLLSEWPPGFFTQWDETLLDLLS